MALSKVTPAGEDFPPLPPPRPPRAVAVVVEVALPRDAAGLEDIEAEVSSSLSKGESIVEVRELLAPDLAPRPRAAFAAGAAVALPFPFAWAVIPPLLLLLAKESSSLISMGSGSFLVFFRVAP